MPRDVRAGGPSAFADAATFFPAGYLPGRQRFRDAAAALGWRLDVREIDARGPAGEPLSIDLAISPHENRRQTLVVSSGLHGVEGAFGSAVQLALLERWRRRAPTVRCVLVHALNPFGWAWRRRTDDLNVDLNRNFLLDGEAYAGSPPGYAALDALLNPSRAPARWDPFLVRMLPALMRQGPAAVRRAVAVGQYEFPRGLFFGGTGPTPARRAIETALGAGLAGVESVVHVDLHTGLGRRAEGVLLIDYPLEPWQRDRLVRWFGPGTLQMPAPGDAPYTARGGLGRWCVSRASAGAYLFAYAEFGTFGGARVLAGLRRENQAHHWGAPSSPATRRARQALQELFCPADPAWRDRSLARGVDIVARVARGMASEEVRPDV